MRSGQITVESEEFLEALKTLSRVAGRGRSKMAMLTVQEGSLTLDIGEVAAAVECTGAFDGETRLRAINLFRMAKALPKAGPLDIELNEDSFKAGTVLITSPKPTDEDKGIGIEDRVRRAAGLLAPFQVKVEDVARLVMSRSESGGTRQDPDRVLLSIDTELLRQMTDAWGKRPLEAAKVLSPLGIGLEDIRNLIHSSFRQR